MKEFFMLGPYPKTNPGWTTDTVSRTILCILHTGRIFITRVIIFIFFLIEFFIPFNDRYIKMV